MENFKTELLKQLAAYPEFRHLFLGCCNMLQEVAVDSSFVGGMFFHAVRNNGGDALQAKTIAEIASQCYYEEVIAPNFETQASEQYKPLHVDILNDVYGNIWPNRPIIGLPPNVNDFNDFNDF